MAVRQTALLTAADYRALPESGPRYQLVQGELVMAPAPNRYHQDISRNIEFLLLRYLEDHPLGKLYHAPLDVYLSEHNVYQPDILFVGEEQLSVLKDDGVHGAPQFVVEILSDSTVRLDKVTKKKVYARAGVLELWLIDPEERTVAVFHLQEDPDQPAAVWNSENRFQSRCFPGLLIDARDVFKA